MQIPNPAAVTPSPHVLELTVVINVPYTQPTVRTRSSPRALLDPALSSQVPCKAPGRWCYTLFLAVALGAPLAAALPQPCAAFAAQASLPVGPEANRTSRSCWPV